MKAPVLNERQAEFCRRYTSGPTAGVGSASARAAGYTGTAKAIEVTASRLLRHEGVIAQIRLLRAAADDASAADARELRLFLSSVMRGKTTESRPTRSGRVVESCSLHARLRAADQLAKLSGLYSEHLIHQVGGAPQGGPIKHEVKLTLVDAHELAK